MQKVAELIEGFETPYSMELLATVHWVAVHDKIDAEDGEAITQAVHAWNQPKRDIFQSDHIKVVWQQLLSQGWIETDNGLC